MVGNFSGNYSLLDMQNREKVLANESPLLERGFILHIPNKKHDIRR